MVQKGLWKDPCHPAWGPGPGRAEPAGLAGLLCTARPCAQLRNHTAAGSQCSWPPCAGLAHECMQTKQGGCKGFTS